MSSKSESNAKSSYVKDFSQTATSQPKASTQHIPQYLHLSRSWPTDAESSYHHASATSHSTAGAQQGLTPMQRWENETMKQSHWTNVGEYRASDTTAKKTNEQVQNGGGESQQNWSMMGDD